MYTCSYFHIYSRSATMHKKLPVIWHNSSPLIPTLRSVSLILTLPIALSKSLQGIDIVRVPNAARWLHAVHIISPPWATTPPQGANPGVGVLCHVCKHTGNGRLALVIGTTGKLADDPLLPVRLKPLSRGLDALLSDRSRNAVLARSRSVGVEILMHLVDDLVRWISQGRESVVARCGPENVSEVLEAISGKLTKSRRRCKRFPPQRWSGWWRRRHGYR